ncbi:MAG: metalloregulator ArsR/SmtB family transcription factor [Limosilactobacillus oris]|jgi:DNA-binding transcriptional ArsR family regulator|uniref:ArsR/SmtB family transcription factor n=1 Tax=Limosilactobacillus oris TaxID=1632 RepID=UPI00174D96C9|nr:metalloregulator ArsR/SmtB family transcription factor [Limosilactobacillus oris]MCH3910898.1 metalloregulator ArsR/SmtB family transcription factor [Limosilactobacillus oris]MCH3938150.1 metalloregulator ArsR/SmtB family transcription factor [Limosilactobacillus oris]MCI1981218.1 metalloregulator ArsR/SmtB family transcription factor [Limosilactobacillus oris]UXC66617.1 metalloregulator ArsR/SmtB family transcription factor [Limosilactobacillus oris]HJF46821.1 metalloregulator ArsR/SmtB fa
MDTSDNLINEAAKIYKVLSNPTRIKILYFLRYQEIDIQVNDIVTQLKIAQPVISKQLGILRRYQLVRNRKEGNKVFYILDDPHVVEMVDDMLNHVKHEIKGLPHPKNLY